MRFRAGKVLEKVLHAAQRMPSFIMQVDEQSEHHPIISDMAPACPEASRRETNGMQPRFAPARHQ